MGSRIRKRKKNSVNDACKKNTSVSDSKKKPIPQPVDISDGIPDRADPPSRYRLLLIAIIFAGWVAFLVYCLLASRPDSGAL